MNYLKKIILLCVMHCAVAISSKGDMAHEWDQILSPNIKWVTSVNNAELFYDMLPGENNNSLAVLEWMNPETDSPTGFNLTTITHTFDGKPASYQKCSFPAEEDIDFQTPVKVTYLRSNRVLVYFTKTHKTKGRVQIPQVINTDLCQLEEGTNTEPYVRFAAVYIVPFKNSFDVIFENKTLCPEDSWCRMTFDHDGKKISEPTSIYSKDWNIRDEDKFYPLNYGGDKEDFAVVVHDAGIWSPIRKWIPIKDFEKTLHFYSNTSGFASVCWQTENLREIKCIWLDETHRDKKGVDSTITIPMNGRVKKMLYTHNTAKGKIAILKEGKDGDKKLIFSDTANLEGKCKRYMKTEFTNVLKKVQLTIVGNDKSCISFVTKTPKPVSENAYSEHYTYRFESKCTEFSKDSSPEQIDCGKNYA